MEKTEILKKAFAKAIKAGWLLKTGNGNLYKVTKTEEENEAYTRIRVELQDGESEDYTYFIRDSEMLTMTHGFAEAFWGSKDTIRVSHNYNLYQGDRATLTRSEVPVWKYHLQQMVLEKEPIEYLEKFL